jgi:hypothetical protein
MGAKKTTSTTVNQAPQFVAPPKNEYYEKATKNLDNLDFTTPIIQGFGQQDNLIKESGNDIYGANTSPEIADKVRNSRLFKSATDKFEIGFNNRVDCVELDFGFVAVAEMTCFHCRLRFHPLGFQIF